jgi:hypothetical protein
MLSAAALALIASVGVVGCQQESSDDTGATQTEGEAGDAGAALGRAGEDASEQSN